MPIARVPPAKVVILLSQSSRDRDLDITLNHVGRHTCMPRCMPRMTKTLKKNGYVLKKIGENVDENSLHRVRSDRS